PPRESAARPEDHADSASPHPARTTSDDRGHGRGADAGTPRNCSGTRQDRGIERTVRRHHGGSPVHRSAKAPGLVNPERRRWAREITRSAATYAINYTHGKTRGRAGASWARNHSGQPFRKEVPT